MTTDYDRTISIPDDANLSTLSGIARHYGLIIEQIAKSLEDIADSTYEAGGSYDEEMSGDTPIDFLIRRASDLAGRLQADLEDVHKVINA